MEALSPTQFFEHHSRHCPILTAVNRMRYPPNQKLWRFVVFVILVYFVYNCHQHYDWIKNVMLQGQMQGTDQPQPSDGGLGGQNNGGGHSNEKSSEVGGSHDPPQAPSSRGGSSSSSGGDNGGDDPNRKRPTNSEPPDGTLVESKEEEGKNTEDDDDNEMVVHHLPQQPPANVMPLSGMRDIHQGASVMSSGLCSNPWMSSSSAAVKSFVSGEQLKICQPEEKEAIHEGTDEEPQPHQPPQSAASIGEEQLDFEFSSVTTGEGILEQLPFYTTIEIESFSGPRSDPHVGEEVSTESTQALHASTYYDLAHLQIVQEQVLQASEATEPFDYTLAIVMYHHGNQLLIPCLPDAEFDPTDDVHVVAVPADCVVPEFIVHVNPYLLHHVQ